MRPSAIRRIHDLAHELSGQALKGAQIRLHFGEPDLGTPDFIIDAACRALRDGAVFYENNQGRPDLTEALATFYRQHHGVELTPDHFVVTCGAMQAIHLTMLGLLSPADRVINITPSWPNFTEAARMAGARVVEIPLQLSAAGHGFEIDFDAIEGTLADGLTTRMLIVNSPSNPTGWVMKPHEQNRLLKLCDDHSLMLVSDEIYDRIVFTADAAPSTLRNARSMDRLVVINGFSKTYCMTGWRLGYLITQPQRAARLARMQEFLVSHAPSMAQVAAITALREGERFIDANRSRYRHLRDLVAKRLSRLPGARVARCDGTFYSFFSLPQARDSAAFCEELLRATGVVLAPGSAFGAGGEGWLRLCFANEPAALEEAIDRIEGFLSGPAHAIRGQAPGQR